jgi:hypothetical protein
MIWVASNSVRIKGKDLYAKLSERHGNAQQGRLTVVIPYLAITGRSSWATTAGSQTAVLLSCKYLKNCKDFADRQKTKLTDDPG